MPIETAVVLTAILIAFTGFIVVLAWAERQTRSLKRQGDVGAELRVEAKEQPGVSSNQPAIHHA